MTFGKLILGVQFLGWLMLAAALALAGRKLLRQRSWKSAKGVVVALGPERPGESPLEPVPSHYFPVVRFSTGVQEVCEEARSFQFGACAVGDTLRLLYDPKEPSRFCSVSLFRRYGAEAMLAALGVFFVIVARG